MDLISLGLRYLNLIIVMAKDGISVYIYMGLDKLKKQNK